MGQRSLHKTRKRGSAGKHLWRKPQFEQLERRQLLAIYLPDSFANANLQPVGTAYNQGEQVFFGGHSGRLQFSFGSSAAGSTYNGSGWGQGDVAALIGTSLPLVAGTPRTYESPATPGGAPQLHAVYRSTGGAIVDVWSTPWQAQQLVGSGAASDPTAATLNGGRQVLYVSTSGHVHLMASSDFGAHWGNANLTDLVGLAADPSAVAVPTSGIAAFQVGAFEYYVYHRADGQLGYFLWNGSAWGYDALDATDIPSYIAPTTGPRGQLEGLSYNTTGGGTPNVGWVFYRGGDGRLHGIWLAEGGPWRGAVLSQVQMLGAPSAAFDPVGRRVSVAFVDNNAHLRLLREASTWTNQDFHNTSTLSMPLSNLGKADTLAGHTQASGTVNLSSTGSTFTLSAVAGAAADGAVGNLTKIAFVAGQNATQASGLLVLPVSGGAYSISAAAGSSVDGAAGNSVTISMTADTLTAATYDSVTNHLDVTVAAGATLGDVEAALSGLGEFNASLVGGLSSQSFDAGDLLNYGTPLAGGTDATVVASYSVATNTITVAVGEGVTASQIATAINSLAAFNTSGVVNGSAIWNTADLGLQQNVLAGGSTIFAPGVAVKPSIYFRPHASAGAPASLHIVYKDQSNHVQNVRASGGLTAVFNATAYMEGYRPSYGYGVVNAATAVAYALGSATPLTGPAGGSWNLALVRAPSVWNTATGQNVAIFALDSGIDPNNADIVQLTGFNAAGNNSNTTDIHGHGTGVAGIIAGVNDGQGVTGVAYNARVVPVKIGDGAVASEAAIVAGINYAANYVLPSGYNAQARVMNMSFASTSTSLASVRNAMYEKSPNTVFVMAAGNRTRTSPDLPAAYGVGFGIVAGAINSASRLWSPSNGTAGALTPFNYVLAPGVNVATSAIVGVTGNNHHTTVVDGTSAAAAHISGVIALMLEANPLLTAREIESILIASADQVVTQLVNASAPPIPTVNHWAGWENPAPEFTASVASLVDAAKQTGSAAGRLSDAAENFADQVRALPRTVPRRVEQMARNSAAKAADAVFEKQEELTDLLAARFEKLMG
jgi:subtilisin